MLVFNQSYLYRSGGSDQLYWFVMVFCCWLLEQQSQRYPEVSLHSKIQTASAKLPAPVVTSETEVMD